MKEKSIVISAALIAVAVVLLGLSLKAAINHFADRDRVVTVRGLCEKEVAANKVTWPIVTKEAGNDLIAIYSKVKSTNETIVDFLKANGIDDSEIMIGAPQVYDQATERYGSNDYKYRYSVTNVVVVTSQKVQLVQELINKQSDLMRQGLAIIAGTYEYNTSYEYTDLNTIKPEMIAEATANAREAADRFAADSHSKLGKIQSATQGQFSITDRDQYTPSIKTVRVVTYITYYLQD